MRTDIPVQVNAALYTGYIESSLVDRFHHFLITFIMFLFTGSKNPQATLKLAEIKTDHQGRVSLSFLLFILKGFIIFIFSYLL